MPFASPGPWMSDGARAIPTELLGIGPHLSPTHRHHRASGLHPAPPVRQPPAADQPPPTQPPAGPTGRRPPPAEPGALAASEGAGPGPPAPRPARGPGPP